MSSKSARSLRPRSALHSHWSAQHARIQRSFQIGGFALLLAFGLSIPAYLFLR